MIAESTSLELSPAVFELLHARHHGKIHATVLGTPFIKCRCADAKLSANIWRADTCFSTFDRVHDAIADPCFLLGDRLSELVEYHTATHA